MIVQNVMKHISWISIFFLWQAFPRSLRRFQELHPLKPPSPINANGCRRRTPKKVVNYICIFSKVKITASSYLLHTLVLSKPHRPSCPPQRSTKIIAVVPAARPFIAYSEYSHDLFLKSLGFFFFFCCTLNTRNLYWVYDFLEAWRVTFYFFHQIQKRSIVYEIPGKS